MLLFAPALLPHLLILSFGVSHLLLNYLSDPESGRLAEAEDMPYRVSNLVYFRFPRTADEGIVSHLLAPL